MNAQLFTEPLTMVLVKQMRMESMSVNFPEEKHICKAFWVLTTGKIKT